MIVDKIENSHLYAGISRRMAKAFEILKDKSLASKADGKYEVDGKNLYFLVMHYPTKPVEERPFETHRQYIDIQFLADGQEMIGYTPADKLAVDTPYMPEQDAALYKRPDCFTQLNMIKGTFAVFFPHDAHMPCCNLSHVSNVHKIVVKVKVDG